MVASEDDVGCNWPIPSIEGASFAVGDRLGWSGGSVASTDAQEGAIRAPVLAQKSNLFQGRRDVASRLMFASIAGPTTRGWLGMVAMGLGTLGGVDGASLDEPRATIYF